MRRAAGLGPVLTCARTSSMAVSAGHSGKLLVQSAPAAWLLPLWDHPVAVISRNTVVAGGGRLWPQGATSIRFPFPSLARTRTHGFIS